VPPVLMKTARILRLGRVKTIRQIILPFATLYIFTGLKLAVAYSFIGVIAAEFLLSGEGMGYEIAFAFNNFENTVMYPLILLIYAIPQVTILPLFILYFGLGPAGKVAFGFSHGIFVGPAADVAQHESHGRRG